VTGPDMQRLDILLDISHILRPGLSKTVLIASDTRRNSLFALVYFIPWEFCKKDDIFLILNSVPL
jgi:hypothetical protein